VILPEVLVPPIVFITRQEDEILTGKKIVCLMQMDSIRKFLIKSVHLNVEKTGALTVLKTGASWPHEKISRIGHVHDDAIYFTSGGFHLRHSAQGH
jgi:2-methylaconitate cis-trans-isomerase PrpF